MAGNMAAGTFKDAQSHSYCHPLKLTTAVVIFPKL